MATQTQIGSSKVPLVLPYGTISVGDASGTLYIPGFASVKEYRMNNAGSVIGIGENLSGTLLTGTLTFYPTKNGSPMAGTFANGTINISTFGTYERDQSQQGIFSFAAGDTVGVGFTKAGTVTPTTRDLSVIMLVLLDNYDY